MKLTMNIYTHVEMDERASAINGLPTPPLLQSLTSPETPDVHPFVQGFAKNPALDDADCRLTAQSDQTQDGEHTDEDTKKPLENQEFDTPCLLLSLCDASSGGGTRTPDTRIMIPLL